MSDANRETLAPLPCFSQKDLTTDPLRAGGLRLHMQMMMTSGNFQELSQEQNGVGNRKSSLKPLSNLS